jgi:nucleoside-diphosphate-sugar epimerase
LRSGPESVLVTGASGLCGSQVCEHLSGGADPFRVLTLSRRPLDRPDHFQHDLRDPIPEGLISGDIDTIVHCAALVDERDDSYEVLDANVRMSFNLATFARARGVKRIVNLSSIAVYGAAPDARDVAEHSGLWPRSTYGVAKVLVESLLSSAAPDIDVAHLRLGYVLAPVMPERTFIVRLARRMAADEPVEIVNPDSTSFTFIEAADVARTCELVLRDGASGPLNVLADDRPTLREVTEAIVSHHSASASAVSYLERPEERISQSFDTSRVKALLGVARIGDPLAAIRAAEL